MIDEEDGRDDARVGAEGYTRLSVIGRGGTATVHRAVRIADAAVVAIKSFDDGEDASFDRQLRAGEMLRDVPGIAATLDEGTSSDGRRFLVTPFVGGGSLAERMRQLGGLPAEEVTALGQQLAVTLAAAHAEGVLHRDLKPSNVLLDDEGASVLSDFGAAGFVDAATASATMTVTLLYAAPEVLEGAAADERSDVYSLGLTLVAASIGRSPFGGPGAAGSTGALGTTGVASVVNRICTDGVPADVFADLPVGLAAVLRAATELDPGYRYPTAASFAAALDEVAADPTIVPEGTTRRRSGGTLRSGRWLGAIAAVLVVCVVAGVIALTRPDDASPTSDEFGEPVTEPNGILGPLYEHGYADYVGVLDPGCGDDQRLVELSIHAGPEDFAAGVDTPWEAVAGEGAGTFVAYMPCDTGIDEARYFLGATGRWFVLAAELPAEMYDPISEQMRVNENSPTPDYTVDEDVLAALEDPDVYKGWAIIDQEAE